MSLSLLPCGVVLGFGIFVFFFFQAEDGIRDHCVTGVQTCALPISIGNVTSCSTSWGARPSASVRMLTFGRLRSEERRVGKSVDLGGGRIIKKKKNKEEKNKEWRYQNYYSVVNYNAMA